MGGIDYIKRFGPKTARRMGDSNGKGPGNIAWKLGVLLLVGNCRARAQARIARKGFGATIGRILVILQASTLAAAC